MYWLVIFTRSSSISEHFAVVPPMSSAMTFGSPISLPSAAAPSTPLAGPDSTMVIGVALAAVAVSITAVGLHDVEGAAEPGRRQPALHAAQVFVGDGVGRRRTTRSCWSVHIRAIRG